MVRAAAARIARAPTAGRSPKQALGNWYGSPPTDSTSPGGLLLLLGALYLLLAFFSGKLEWLFNLGQAVQQASGAEPATATSTSTSTSAHGSTAAVYYGPFGPGLARPVTAGPRVATA